MPTSNPRKKKLGNVLFYTFPTCPWANLIPILITHSTEKLLLSTYDQAWPVSLYSYRVWFTHPICFITSTPSFHTIKEGDLITVAYHCKVNCLWYKERQGSIRSAKVKLQQLTPWGTSKSSGCIQEKNKYK